MKKQNQLIKMFICLLIFICLLSCENNNLMYQLTLDGNGATIHNMDRIYYNASNGKWYSDTGIATPITKVTVPKRQFTVKYDYNTDNTIISRPEEVISPYSFSSYPGYTDSQGNILPDSSLKANAVAYANWVIGTNGDVTVKLSSAEPKAEGLKFTGWKKKAEDTYTYNADQEIIFKQDEIVNNTAYLIATWETQKEVSLILKSSQDSATYSEYRYKQSNNKWYNSQGEEVISVPIPEKKYRIDFDPNTPNIDRGAIGYSDFPFEGYYVDNTQYVNEQGALIESLSEEDLQKGVINAFAKWGEQKPVILPELNKNGEKFLGWNKSGSQEEGYSQPGTEYKPNGDEVLKGVWESLPVYKLELSSPDSTTPTIAAIYYRTGDRWYKDENAKSPIEVIDIPKKVWKITFNPNLDDNSTSIPIQYDEYDIKFKGFTLRNGDVIVSSDGKINNYSIDTNIVADAQWENPPLRTVLKNISREGFTLLGWDEDKTVTDPQYKNNVEYKGINNTLLYAIWRDNRLWTVNVIAAPDRPNKKYYYRPSTNEWYKTTDVENQAPITKIDESDMIREYTVYFESNMDSVEDLQAVVYKYTFNGADNCIGADGTFVSAPGGDNIFVQLLWNEGDGIDVSPEAKPIVLSNYKHLGWSTTSDGEVITQAFIPDKDVTLYAKWQDNRLYRLVLDSNGASSMGTAEVFYKQSTNTWYLTGNPDEGDAGIDSIEIPQKIWTAEFDAGYGNSDINNPPALTSVWKFGGYSPYIDNSGNLIKGINADTTVQAMWTDQSPIVMPVITREHYTLKGWSTTGEGQGISGEYIINADELETAGYSVLYKAIWEPNVYKLTLDNDNATSPSVGSIYYIYDKGWFNDEKGLSAFTGMALPEKKWQVKFKPFLDATGIIERSSNWSFGGYATTGESPVSYILNDGTIRNGATLTSNAAVKAIWDNQSEISIPITSEREGFVFDRWQKDGKIVTSPYYPQSNGEVIEGIWVDAHTLKDSIYTFEGGGYVLDSFDKALLILNNNYAIPSTYDDGVNGRHKVVKIKGDASTDSPFKESSNLTYINIPDTIDSIPVSGFRDCINLRNVVLPSTCTNIGDNAFSGCVAIERIIFKGTKEQWKAVARGADWHSGIVNTNVVECSDGNIEIDASLTSI